MNRRQIIQPNNISPIFGIFEGKRKRAKAEAAVLLRNQKAEQERLALAAKVEAEKAGYKTDEIKQAEAAAASTAIEAASSNTLYYILGAIVVVVMIGLYFITKKR